ncbi:DivIVA domain-containing protein [Embleya sp. NBC_00896]|uniref:DivIVA domain-containing protein n=1 Tax=Embleya sp. NBC_00896 TaxID=2975961 RepID=UPI002F90DC33|nr:DivIVA domain-containing protein [Embleya sp. NBC_00896]
MNQPRGDEERGRPHPGSAIRHRTPLTPQRVRSTEFNRASLARRGYDVEEVKMFLGRIAEDIAASDTEKSGLRAEIDRLREWYRQQGVETGPQTQASTSLVPAVKADKQAVAMLSQAQQQADAYVAQAEQYCRQVMGEARRQADEMLRDAQASAESAANDAARAYRAQAGGEYAAELEEMQRRVAWLRAFCHAIQVQLTAASESFAREVAKLADLPANFPSTDFLSAGPTPGAGYRP